MPIEVLNWDGGEELGPGGSGAPGTGSGPGGSSMSSYTDGTATETGTVQVLLGEGQIEGLVNGLKTVYLDGTPIMGANGVANFKGIALSVTSGTNAQPALKGITGTETPQPAYSASPMIYNTPQVKSVVDSNATAVRINIVFQSLYDLNTTTGTRSGSSIQIKIERSPDGVTWTAISLEGNGVISGGPYTSRYMKSYRIDLPYSSSWQLRVTRLTTDADNLNHFNTGYWETTTELMDVKMRYPNSAVASLRVNAKQFSSIPQLTMDMKLKKIWLPSNYNPITRDYAGGVGGWNGNLDQFAWSDNPAWIFYDMASNTRYGAGTFLDVAKLDKWALYSIAQWCDTMVLDGKGGYEPRMTANIFLQGAQNAIRALGTLASVFWGVLYYAGGLVTPVADSDTAPVALFTNSNVEGGSFIYEGTARQARHTACTVKFINPALNYYEDYAIYEDEAGIVRFGYNCLDVIGVACTSYGQALRLAKLSVLTELLATDMVSFTAGLEGSLASPGDVIQINDQFRAGSARFGGRVVSATTSSVTLDAPVTIASGTYTLKCQTSLGMESKTVTTGAGTTSTLSVSGNFTSAPLAGTGWLLQAGTTASLWRVVAVSKGEGLKYSVSAILHDPSKYIKLGLTAGDVVQRTPRTYNMAAPTGLTLTAATTLLNDRQQMTLYATWNLDLASSYIAQASRDYGPWVNMAVSGTMASLDGVLPGAYRVRVSGVWRQSGISPYAETSGTIDASGLVPTWVQNIMNNIDKIGADSVLSKDEKSAVMLDFDSIAYERDSVWSNFPLKPTYPATPVGEGLDRQAYTYTDSTQTTVGAVDTARAQYDAAVDALATYLYSLT